MLLLPPPPCREILTRYGEDDKMKPGRSAHVVTYNKHVSGRPETIHTSQNEREVRTSKGVFYDLHPPCLIYDQYFQASSSRFTFTLIV